MEEMKKFMQQFEKIRAQVESCITNTPAPKKEFKYELVKGTLIGLPAATNFEWPKKLKDLMEDDLESLRLKKFMMNHTRGHNLHNVKVELSNGMTSFDVRDDDDAHMPITDSYDMPQDKEIKRVLFRYNPPNPRCQAHFFTQVKFVFEDDTEQISV